MLGPVPLVCRSFKLVPESSRSSCTPGARAGFGRKLTNRAAAVVECDLEDFVAAGGLPFLVVANPPYLLTAAVLTFVARASHLTAADLVLQRAVVRRAVDQDRRQLRHFHATRGLALPRSAFIPPPPVDSAVLQLRPRKR